MKEAESLLLDEEELLPKASEMLRTFPKGSRDDFIEVSFVTCFF